MTSDEAINFLLRRTRDEVDKVWEDSRLWLYGRNYAVELLTTENGEPDGYAYKALFSWERPMAIEWVRCDEGVTDRLDLDPRDWQEALAYMVTEIQATDT